MLNLWKASGALVPASQSLTAEPPPGKALGETSVMKSTTAIAVSIRTIVILPAMRLSQCLFSGPVSTARFDEFAFQYRSIKAFPPEFDFGSGEPNLVTATGFGPE